MRLTPRLRCGGAGPGGSDVRQGVAALPSRLLAAPREPSLRAAPRTLVCAEPSDGGLRGDLRRVAAAALALAQPVRWLAGARQARVRGCHHARPGGTPRGEAQSRDVVEPLAGEHAVRCASTTGASRSDTRSTPPIAYDRRLLRVFGAARRSPARRWRPAGSCARCSPQLQPAARAPGAHASIPRRITCCAPQLSARDSSICACKGSQRRRKRAGRSRCSSASCSTC